MKKIKRKFSRIFKADERDDEWAVPEFKTKRKTRFWPKPYIFDQGNSPMCVAYAWLGFFHDYPKPHQLINGGPFIDPFRYYKLSQHFDDIPGRDYEGTTVRGGAKAGVAIGEDVEYRWAKNLSQMVNTVADSGPMVFGSNWYDSMMNPGFDNFLHIGTGDVVGGHAFVLSGVNIPEQFFEVQNSWGEGWGVAGVAKLAFQDAERLLHEEGEACIAMEKD